MSKHVIFLVHGMGDFAKKWSEDTQAQVKQLYSAYNFAGSFPFDTFFRFEEITYNGRFDALRKQWRDGSQSVVKQLKEGGIESGLLKDLAKAAAAPGAEDQFLSSHVLDVVLYRFIPMVAEEARTLVAKRILETLLATAEPPRWSVVAHSLGTAVAHDALHALFTQEVGGTTLAGRTKADVIMMVANVSRVLEQKQVDVYRSHVRPGAGEAGACRVYLNAKHEWDPFPRPREFRPLEDWPDVLTRAQDRYRAVTINSFQSKNVHSLTHYLSNPSVHVAFFRSLFPMEIIPEEEFKKAKALFESQTPFGAFESLQKELKKFQISEQASWKDIVKAYQGFMNTVQAF